MQDYKKQLVNISKCIINSSSIQEELRYAKLLSDFFAQFTYADNPNRYIETLLQGGVALSSQNAAACVDDYLRTSRFIKGTYLAIQELLHRFPGQKINILYAGCGPYATLILPILHFFHKKDLEIILLDINESSIQSAKALVSTLGLEDYISDILQGDAVKYKKPESQTLHMVIVEALFHALIREPQTAITANLAPQITKNGILIPEEISIDLVYTFFGKEPYLKKWDGIKEITEKYSGRYKQEKLFSVNKQHNFSDKAHNNSYKFESDLYEIPKKFDDTPDICLFTKIKVFRNIELNSAESHITNPYCLTSIATISNHTHFKLTYDFRDTPNWSYQLKNLAPILI